MLLALIGFSGFSAGDVVIKHLTGFYDLTVIAFYLNMVLFTGILCLSPKLGGLMPALKTKKLKYHLVRAAMSMCAFFAMISGFKEIGLATSYTLIFIGPFIAAIFAFYFMDEKIGVHRWATIATGFAGVMVVLRPGLIPLEPAAVAILGAAVLYAAGSVILRRIGEHEPMLAFVIFGTTVSLCVFGALAVSQPGPLPLPPPAHIGLLLCVGACHLTGALCTAKAFSSAETSVVAPFHYIQLLWGLLFGYLLFGTLVDFWTLAGAAIIVASGIYMIHREHVNHRELTKGVVSDEPIHTG